MILILRKHITSVLFFVLTSIGFLISSPARSAAGVAQSAAAIARDPAPPRVLMPSMIADFDFGAAPLSAVEAPLDRRRRSHELDFPPNFERLVLGCIDADFCK